MLSAWIKLNVYPVGTGSGIQFCKRTSLGFKNSFNDHDCWRKTGCQVAILIASRFVEYILAGYNIEKHPGEDLGP